MLDSAVLDQTPLAEALRQVPHSDASDSLDDWLPKMSGELERSSKHFQQLAVQLLQCDPSKRISAAEALTQCNFLLL